MATRKNHSNSSQPKSQQSQPPVIEAEVVSEPAATAVSKENTYEHLQHEHLELVAQVNELRTALEKTQRKENILQETVAQVNELRTALEKTQRKENILQETVNHFQEQLDDQKALIEKLQASIEKTNQIRIELEQAQKTALKLAEANQELITENHELMQAQQNQKVEQNGQQNALQLADAPKPDLRSQQEVLRQRQAARLSHPVFPNRPDQSSEPDVGWVD